MVKSGQPGWGMKLGIVLLALLIVPQVCILIDSVVRTRSLIDAGVLVVLVAIPVTTFFLIRGDGARSFVRKHQWAVETRGTIDDLASFPLIHPAGTEIAWAASGQWRGRRAGRARLTPVGTTRVGATSFRVEAVHLDFRLPRLAFVPRRAPQWVPRGSSEDLAVGAAAFDRRFRVIASDAGAGRAVLTAGLIERLLRKDVKGLSIGIIGDRLVAWRRGAYRLGGARLPLDVLSDVADLISTGVPTRYVLDPSVAPAPDWQWGLATRNGGVASPKKGPSNWMAWWSLGLAFNFFPIALILAHAARRAARRGEATNGDVAKAVLTYWYVGMAVAVPLIAMMFWIQSG